MVTWFCIGGSLLYWVIFVSERYSVSMKCFFLSVTGVVSVNYFLRSEFFITYGVLFSVCESLCVSRLCMVRYCAWESHGSWSYFVYFFLLKSFILY